MRVGRVVSRMLAVVVIGTLCMIAVPAPSVLAVNDEPLTQHSVTSR